MTIRLLLADDHALVRAGLAKIIAGYPDCEVVGEAADGYEAVNLARELVPDVVVLDISMPGLNGFDACEQILEHRPETHVIVLSMHTAEDFVRRAFGAGAKGYIIKHAAPEELEQAVRMVTQGGIFLSPRLADRIGERLRGGVPTAAKKELSARERQVLRLIAQGISTRGIAEQLHISVKTVETHRAHIMKGLDIDNVAGLTRYAIRIGLIPPDG
jgi:DNA-binding NarL/FixJ family response regulator